MSNSPAAANTHDLAKDLAESEVGKGLGLSVTKSQDLILAVVHSIAARLAQHQTVRIHNMGNFKVLPTKERQGKNPKTGEAIKIEAGHRVHLAVSQFFKDSATEKKVPVREPRQPAARPAGQKAAKPAAPAKGGAKAAAPAAKPAAPPKSGFRPGGAPAAGTPTDEV
jgi:DNA-binding protein HU-beta